MLLSIEDYTKRKYAEQRLWESEQRFRRMFETSSDGLLLINKETGVITNANPALFELLGKTEDEIVGKQIHEAGLLGSESDKQRLLETLRVKGRHTLESELINLKAARSFHAQISFTNRSAAIQCNVRDISERIQENRLLKERAAEWQTIFNAFPDLITVLDLDMRIVRSNDAFNRFFSVTPEEVKGRHCYEFICNSDGPCPACPAFATLRDTHIHSKLIKHDAIDKTFEVSTVPMINQNGDLLYLINIARDITQLQKMERQLQQA